MDSGGGGGGGHASVGTSIQRRQRSEEAFVHMSSTVQAEYESIASGVCDSLGCTIIVRSVEIVDPDSVFVHTRSSLDSPCVVRRFRPIHLTSGAEDVVRHKRVKSSAFSATRRALPPVPTSSLEQKLLQAFSCYCTTLSRLQTCSERLRLNKVRYVSCLLTRCGKRLGAPRVASANTTSAPDHASQIGTAPHHAGVRGWKSLSTPNPIRQPSNTKGCSGSMCLHL